MRRSEGHNRTQEGSSKKNLADTAATWLVNERTAELENVNDRLRLEIEERERAEEALKLFAYSIAHDLKSPAIGIHGITNRLKRKYGNLLDETETLL